MGGPKRTVGTVDIKYIYIKVVDEQFVQTVILAPVCNSLNIPP